MTCHESETLFIDVLYEEVTPEALTRFNQHLSNCQSCAKTLSSFRQTLSIMNRFDRPMPDDRRWERMWGEIETGLMDNRKEELSIRPAGTPFLVRLIRFPSWAYGAAAILLVAVGIYIGKFYWTEAPPTEGGKTDSLPAMSVSKMIDRSELEREAFAYINRSKVLLQDIVNGPDEGGEGRDFSRQQDVARQLFVRASYLASELKAPDEQRLRQLILDLEVILLQLTNTELRPGVPLVEIVRHGVREKSIWLKINLEEIRAVTKQDRQRRNRNTVSKSNS